MPFVLPNLLVRVWTSDMHMLCVSIWTPVFVLFWFGGFLQFRPRQLIFLTPGSTAQYGTDVWSFLDSRYKNFGRQVQLNDVGRIALNIPLTVQPYQPCNTTSQIQQFLSEHSMSPSLTHTDLYGAYNGPDKELIWTWEPKRHSRIVVSI
jgi:hypothetical protein